MSFMPSARWRDVTGASRRRRRFDGIASNHASPAPLARHRREGSTPSTQVHLKSFTRAASGKIDDHVWIEKLDLRTHLQAPPSAPEGIDLLALCQKLLTNAIRPVLKEVNITGALGHIAGAFFSSSSSRGQSTLDVIPTPDVVAHCVEINQCVGCGAVRNRYRHAIEQVSRRWRGGRRDDSAGTARRKISMELAAPVVVRQLA